MGICVPSPVRNEIPSVTSERSLIPVARARFLAGVIWLLSAASSARAQSNLDDQKRALDAIAAFADRLCPVVKDKGSTTSLELTGQAKVELNKLLKQLADAGVTGAAKYQTTETEGVLQKDLSSAMKSSQDCRIAVFKELNSKLVPSQLTSRRTQSAVVPPINPRAPPTCDAHGRGCPGFDDLLGIWRGKVPNGPSLTISVDTTKDSSVVASFVIEQQQCQASLALRRANAMFTTSQFFFAPEHVTTGCPGIESITLTPMPTSASFTLTKLDGSQVAVVLNKKPF
jgi:hypothetical protein